MTERDRFIILDKERVNPNVYKYISTLLHNLNVEICSKEGFPFMSLCNSGKLEGWCWQSTESAALFMPDDAMVYRGDLSLKYDHDYFHSFLVFNFMGREYVFDPCFTLINSSALYFKTFDVVVKGYASAKDIKEYFLNYYNNPPKKTVYDEKTQAMIDKFYNHYFGDIEREPEVVIHDKEDPYAPMFRNGCGYKRLEMESNNIRSVTVHYYMNG